MFPHLFKLIERRFWTLSTMSRLALLSGLGLVVSIAIQALAAAHLHVATFQAIPLGIRVKIG